MRNRSTSAVVLLFALWTATSLPFTYGQAAGAQAADTGSVYGHVFCADTQKPARFATVRLIAGAASGDSSSLGRILGGGSMATTTADGSFEITGVSPGEYYVDATLNGYVQPMRGIRMDDLALLSTGDQEKLLGQVTHVTVLPNQAVTAQVTLYRGGVLSGVVSYDDGSAAPGVFVLAQVAAADASTSGASVAPGTVAQTTATTGRPRRFSNSAQTDDRGQFRISGLPDGVYTVEAWPRTLFPIFLGNTVQRSAAKKVEVRGGDEHTGLDVQVPVAGLHRVTGSVVAHRDGHGLPRASVELRLADESSGPGLNALTAADGSFAFNAVPDGKYMASVSGYSDRGASGASQYSGASVAVEVSGGDAGAVMISLPAALGNVAE